MGIYIFPIFLFGCAVTAIVFLGIQQARDWAKDEADQNGKAGRDSANISTRESATETTVKRN
jgi:hypothetical protein